MRVPSVAGRQRVTLAQAGPPAPEQKALVDCAVLGEDLFIDLKEVVKAGCMPSEKQIAKLLDNPVGNFVALPVQFDAVQVRAPQTGDTEVLYKLQFTPTFPISLGRSDWNLINRVVFPFYSAPLNKGVGDLVGLTPDEILSSSEFLRRVWPTPTIGPPASAIWSTWGCSRPRNPSRSKRRAGC